VHVPKREVGQSGSMHVEKLKKRRGSTLKPGIGVSDHAKLLWNCTMDIYYISSPVGNARFVKICQDGVFEIQKTLLNYRVKVFKLLPSPPVSLEISNWQAP